MIGRVSFAIIKIEKRKKEDQVLIHSSGLNNIPMTAYDDHNHFDIIYCKVSTCYSRGETVNKLIVGEFTLYAG